MSLNKRSELLGDKKTVSVDADVASVLASIEPEKKKVDLPDSL